MSEYALDRKGELGYTPDWCFLSLRTGSIKNNHYAREWKFWKLEKHTQKIRYQSTIFYHVGTEKDKLALSAMLTMK